MSPETYSNGTPVEIHDVMPLLPKDDGISWMDVVGWLMVLAAAIYVVATWWG